MPLPSWSWRGTPASRAGTWICRLLAAADFRRCRLRRCRRVRHLASAATLRGAGASQATSAPYWRATLEEMAMSFVLVVIAWCLLFVVAWPLALLAIFLLPLLWLLSLPFRALAVVVEALFVFIKAVLLLPARLLGHRG